MTQTLTHFKKLINPDYLGAYSLMDGELHELNVTILNVQNKSITGSDGKQEEVTIATLKDQKPMILNVTNQKAIAKALGTPYIEQWYGKVVTLYVAKIRAFGENVEALRIRDKAPKIEPEQLTPDHPKWSDAKAAIAAGTVTIEQIQKKYVVSTENITNLCN
jgi:hypothetical protein